MDNLPHFPQAKAQIGLLGVAFDENSSFRRGPGLAPALIRAAFLCDSANLWTENETYLGVSGIFADAGDIHPSQADMPSETYRAACDLHQAGLKVFAFGGDHSVTFPLVRAAARFHPELTILHLDAHPDLYDNFEDNPNSHASPFARIMESGLARRLVQVGIRTINGHQRQQAQRFGVEVLTMRHWREVFDLRFSGPVYVSLDTDCLDPAFAPGISHREPGGLTTREAIEIIQSLKADIVSADIVEYNPLEDLPSGVPGQPGPGMTAMVCAKLFKEIAARMLE